MAATLSAFAQAPQASGIERLVTKDAASALYSADAETRGEAALIVARSGETQHEARLLELAEDPAPTARRRAILALGLLATPSAVDWLERSLRTVEGRSKDDGVVAAYALGLIPADRAETSVARTLALFQRGSWKRQHDVLVALLQAMAEQPKRTELGALRLLQQEDSNRAEDVRGLLWRLLLPIDGSIERPELTRVLRRGSDAERRAVVRWIIDRPPQQNAAWIKDLEKLAEHDRDVAIRVMALRGLGRCKHGPGLDIAARALTSKHASERKQAVESMLTIGGASSRGALEARLLKERDLESLGALLEGFRAPPSAALLDRAVSITADPRAPEETRVAAAQMVARSAPTRAAPLLRDLFSMISSSKLLARVARALDRVEETPTALSRLIDRPLMLTKHRERWRALLASGHAEAQRQVLMTMQDAEASEQDRRTALKAWRKAMVIQAPDAAPDGLQRALR